MCQFIHVRLSPEEKKEVRKLSGVMIPIYASVAFVLFVAVALMHLPRSDDGIAVAKISPPASDTAPVR